MEKLPPPSRAAMALWAHNSRVYCLSCCRIYFHGFGSSQTDVHSSKHTLEKHAHKISPAPFRKCSYYSRRFGRGNDDRTATTRGKGYMERISRFLYFKQWRINRALSRIDKR